ncbi:hypothetical protein HMPREF1982_00179 [Clostridiales bacterium oral taxon 876 str. F0540]|nr:hypothetical protein HMPREF1982_00179 [Clostridiales bacterium oral taxon 876 str. F0540]
MKKSKVFFICALVIVLMPFIRNKIVASEKPLTLISAYKTAYHKAIKLDKNAKLITMTSGDNPEESTHDIGEDGKRRFWTLEFALPSKNEGVIITIRDAKIELVKEYRKDNINIKELLDNKEINFDSSDVLKKSKKTYNLLPGKGWAIGYHFILQKVNNMPTLSVLGVDLSGYKTNIQYNSLSGEEIVAKHNITDGGKLYCNNLELKIKPSKIISTSLLKVSPNFTSDKTIISLYNIDPYTINMKLFIGISKDAGQTWVDSYLSNDITNIEFSDNYSNDGSIYVVTSRKLLRTNNKISSYECLLDDLNEDIIFFNNRNGILYLLTSTTVYISYNNGKEWTQFKAPDGAKKIFSLSDNKATIFSSDCLYILNNEQWDKIDFPQKMNNIMISETKDLLLIYDFNNLIVFSKLNREFEKVDTPTAIKAVYNNKYDNINTFFLYTYNGDLLQFSRKEDKFKPWNITKRTLTENDNIGTVINDSVGNLYYYTWAQSNWVQIGGKNEKQ